MSACLLLVTFQVYHFSLCPLLVLLVYHLFQRWPLVSIAVQWRLAAVVCQSVCYKLSNDIRHQESLRNDAGIVHDHLLSEKEL